MEENKQEKKEVDIHLQRELDDLNDRLDEQNAKKKKLMMSCKTPIQINFYPLKQSTIYMVQLFPRYL
uniref:Uncharacterized protein n=1 Tax=Heterorhabditis bacteriophora TaxID=37862 RepID=A0A1I7X129_HETBA